MTLYIRNVQNECLYTTKGWRVRKPRGRQLWNLYKPSYGRFCAKIAQILLPWQQVSAQENLNGTINSAIPENPVFGANSAALTFVQAELWPIWVENCPIYVAMATRVDAAKI